MATLEDLNYRSISDMTQDEALEHLRQIRLSRRVPVKKTKKKTSSVTKQKSKPLPKLNAEQAKKLLDLIGDDI